MLIIGQSGSGKTNALLNLIQQDNNNLIEKDLLVCKRFRRTKISIFG